MNNEETRLAKLYGRVRRGDQQALAELCEALEGFVRGYFLKKFRNKTVVDDLCQEAYLRLLKSLPAVREQIKLKRFVAKVVLHVSQDYLRQKYRRKEEDLDVSYNNETQTEVRIKETIDVQEDETLLDKLDMEEALKELPEKSREILLMKSQGFNYEEIATKMGLTTSGVKMQVKRSLEALRVSLF